MNTFIDLSRKSVQLFLLSIVLSGCAALEPVVPQGYSGPIATLRDDVLSESSSKAQIFALIAVDGKSVHNAVIETRSASQGRGFSIVLAPVSRQIPIRELKVKLIGTHATAAPIHEIASRAAGTFYSVEGETTFTPIQGHQYRVRGSLQKVGSSVWIEDEDTHEKFSAVTSK
jgi:hypothetical protein